jgi:EAL domain-containing protein (putative c-di-GMP-specific phosphodiesterase class I)
MEPTALVLEVTEHVLIEDIERAMAVLSDLKKLGIKLALDDFGTGYSSLSHLRQLPIDIVKIDRSFIADIGTVHTGFVIAAAVTELAHVFDLTVKAEGVETQEQSDEVRRIGCDEAQGFFYARPMPASAIPAHISEAEIRSARRSSTLRALPGTG